MSYISIILQGANSDVLNYVLCA